ncbi:hypothetical protein D3C77_810680 [compost metagenome]
MIRCLLLAGKGQHTRCQIERRHLLAQFAPAAAEITGATAGIEQLFAPVLLRHPQ